MTKLIVPVNPNAPTPMPTIDENMVQIILSLNETLGFVENRAFDPAKITYDENYQNSQAHSAAFLEHMRAMAAKVEENYPKDAKIVEVGCGKGEFLELLAGMGFHNIIGFDASYEGEWKAIEKRYLDKRDVGINADLLILRHTLEHIQNPYAFIDMLATINGQNGDILIEVPCFNWIRDNGTFFDITYEHVNYFSQNSLVSMFNEKFKQQGHVFDGQYLYILAKLKDLSHEFNETYADTGNWIELDFKSLFPGFVDQMEELNTLIGENTAYIWGAATKGCLFLNHAHHFNTTLFGKFKAAIDINLGKTGKFLPGTGTPIISSEQYSSVADGNDVILIANPNYLSEIKKNIMQINPEIRCIAL